VTNDVVTTNARAGDSATGRLRVFFDGMKARAWPRLSALGKLSNTTAFKLTLVYLTVFALFAAFLLGYFAWNTRRLITEQITRTVDAEITGLSEQYTQRGLSGLVQIVAARSAGDRGDADIAGRTVHRGHAGLARQPPRERVLTAAAARTAERATAAPGGTAAEEALEQVGDIHPFLLAAETLEPVVAEAALAAPTESTPAKGAGRIAIGVDLAPVEPGPLVLVGQEVIGPGHLAEALGCLGVVLVPVGVKLLGELAIGGLDVLLARAASHPQGRVWICHCA